MHKSDKIKRTKKPWPTQAVMEQIYEKHLWGASSFPFYSGVGSHHPELVNPYIDAVVSFFQSFETPLVVCDLGCGDFNVGKELVQHTKHYIGVDIVRDLIAFNIEKFKQKKLEFHCLDIAKKELPSADCILLRQVLQHLSNEEVKRVVEKLYNYRYIILTEHLPEGDYIPNKDILSGQGIRLKKKSGVSLLTEPFHLKVKKEKELLALKIEKQEGWIVTTLYEI